MSCWISASESDALAEAAGTRADPGPAGVPAGRAKEKTINAVESIAADAKPRRAVEPQNPVHARRHGDGSKILSETNAIRCGISSSRSENKAASVNRNRSTSSRQAAQPLTCASTCLDSASDSSLRA